jgi:osmoprotectant transport system permease protein
VEPRVSYLQDAWHWLTTASQWHGPSGIPDRLLQHLGYSGLALLVAAVISLPLGVLIGHSGRGRLVVVSIANFGRALPTLGLLVLVFILTNGSSEAWLIPLAIIAVPPILVNTFEGVRNVDAGLKDAARGMGMTQPQLMWRVEVPVALPLIMLGLRIAAIQVVATATIAAYIGLGGFGRYIIDGLATDNYSAVSGGAALVVILAVIVQLVFMALSRITVPAGLRGRKERTS